jgi:hypothetical protein
VTDSPSDPTDPRPRRVDPRREPPTIDLRATEVRHDPESGVTPEDEAFRTKEGSDKPAEPTGWGEERASTPTPDEVIPEDGAPGEPPPSAPAAEPLAASSPSGAQADRAPARRRPFGIGAFFAAGIVGGLMGAGLTFLAEPWRRGPSERVDARLAQLEQRVAVDPQNPAAPLEPRIAALENQVRPLAEQVRPLTEQVQAARALAERSAQQAQAAMDRPQPSAPASSPGSQVDRGRLDDLQARLAALESQTQERTRTAAEAAQAGAASQQALERRLAEQDQRLAALTRQVEERRQDGSAASLRLVLAERVGDRLREGAPLGQLLPLLTRLGAKPENVRPLEPYAQQAPPSAPALLQEFKPLGSRIVADSRAASGTWDDRLWRMLDKVVTVRAVGEPSGADGASLVARIENALARGALAEAATAWDALPEPARAQSQDWGARLKQRAAAEAAAQTMSAEALTAVEASVR